VAAKSPQVVLMRNGSAYGYCLRRSGRFHTLAGASHVALAGGFVAYAVEPRRGGKLVGHWQLVVRNLIRRRSVTIGLRRRVDGIDLEAATRLRLMLSPNGGIAWANQCANSHCQHFSLYTYDRATRRVVVLDDETNPTPRSPQLIGHLVSFHDGLVAWIDGQGYPNSIQLTPAV